VMFSEDPAEVNRYVDKTSAGCVGCHAGPVPSATLGDMQKARTFVNEHRVKVLAITAPIYNEPACSVAACHFHSAEQKVLGTLDIGLDQAPLKKTLSLLGSRMIMFSLMVLILTVGGVSALLSRSVFKPIRTLTDFTERAVNGNLEDTFPQIGGEIEQLAGNFRLLLLRYNEAAGRLRQMRADPGAAPDRQDSPGPPDGPTAKQEAAHGIDTRDSSPGADAGSGASRPRGPEENP